MSVPSWLAPYWRAVEERDLGIFEVGSSPVAKTVMPDSARQGLAEAGARLRLAEHLRAEAMLDLRDWVVAAREAGVRPSEIARISTLSRDTVYRILGEAQ